MFWQQIVAQHFTKMLYVFFYLLVEFCHCFGSIFVDTLHPVLCLSVGNKT